jgi:uncharacterized protein YqhQ
MQKIGGQAVIEGVMMKSPRAWTVAVRDSKGNIHLKREALHELPKTLRMPVLRGVVTLYHALSIGIRALEFSASKAYEEESDKPMSKASMALSVGTAVVLAVVLFILLPLYAAKLLGVVIPRVEESSVLFNLADGVVRVFIFILYIVLVGLWGEMRRIFEYHGAEHKVIHALEHDRELELASVKDYSPLHPRCGTSFLMIVMIVSIMVFSLIPQAWPFLYKFLARVVLIPLIAGVSYEALKLSARLSENPFVRLLVLPGLALQQLTTREPDEEQMEVALVALREVLSMEQSAGEAGTPPAIEAVKT